MIWRLFGIFAILCFLFSCSKKDSTGPVVNPINKFVYIQGGTFNNGVSDVTVSSFYVSKYEITQSEYQSVMGVNPSCFNGIANYPVEQINWFNSIEYCNKLSITEGLTPCYSYLTYGTNPVNWPEGWNTNDANHTNLSCDWSVNGYRLLTEAEWEFVAKGGNLTHGYTYSGSNDLNSVGWNYNNSDNTTHSIGLKISNELGVYDMSGNVWEWCWDIHGNFPEGNQINPHGALSGTNRVIHGGGWGDSSMGCRVVNRWSYSPSSSDNVIGLRLCRTSQ